ncbi:MAG: hypothetical protein ACE5JT_04780 [Nitrosopumilaceae archaeon]
MKKLGLLFVLFLIYSIFPAYAQTESNPSVRLETIEIPFEEFNVVSRDSVIREASEVHRYNWQVTIENNLVYERPDGNAAIRLYDYDNPEKFVEIGMGSPPDKKLWIAVQVPDTGYAVIHERLERGWDPSVKIFFAYEENAGLSVNNGDRIVVTNLDIEGLALKKYSVHGLESSTDPLAVNSGSLILDIVSGDPAQNILHFFPFIVVASLGVLVGVLLVTKKRS